MPQRLKFEHPQDQAIYLIHRRYVEAMEQRLDTIQGETKAHYLNVMTSLTAKLEIPGKPLSEIIREVMAEAAPLLFQAMQG